MPQDAEDPEEEESSPNEAVDPRKRPRRRDDDDDDDAAHGADHAEAKDGPAPRKQKKKPEVKDMSKKPKVSSSKAAQHGDEDASPQLWLDSDHEDLLKLPDHERVSPPEHITSNHIYSNSYRVALKLGMELEKAKVRARFCCHFFKNNKWIPKKHVGAFRAVPKTYKA